MNIDRVEISPGAIDREWYRLSVEYGFGESSISLNDLLRAREKGQRFIGTPNGWVDCRSSDLMGIDALEGCRDFKEPDNGSRILKFSRMDLFRIRSLANRIPMVSGKGKDADSLKRILDLKPSGKAPSLFKR